MTVPNDENVAANLTYDTSNDLIGQTVMISKSDYSQVSGVVVKVSKQTINLNLSSDIKGTEENVWITVLDSNGIEQMGFIVK